MAVSVRYFAAASTAAGRDEDTTDEGTLGDLIDRMTEQYGDAMSKILDASSFLVDGVSTYERDAVIKDGQQLDVLPPFAGG